MFKKIKTTLSKVLSKENKSKNSHSRNRSNYNNRSRNRRRNNNQNRQNNHRPSKRTSRQQSHLNTSTIARESGEVNKTTMYRSLASYRKRRDKLDPALPEDVAFRSPDEGGDSTLKIHHANSSYSQKDKARIIFHDKSIFLHDSESQSED